MTTQTGLDECIGYARDAIIEAAEYDKAFLDGMGDDRLRDWINDHQHEAIDGAIPIYNSEIGALVADARVWSQDISEFGSPSDLLQAAQWAIYMAIQEALDEDSTILDAIRDIAGRGDE